MGGTIITSIKTCWYVSIENKGVNTEIDKHKREKENVWDFNLNVSI